MVIPEDLSHLDEPKTYREMFQRIMWLLEVEKKNNCEVREGLEKYIKNQNEITAKLDSRMDALEKVLEVQGESVKTLKESSKKWDIGGLLVGVSALITAIIASLGSG